MSLANLLAWPLTAIALVFMAPWVRWLLAHDSERRAMGAAARQRVLAEHTFRHRAHELVKIVKTYQ